MEFLVAAVAFIFFYTIAVAIVSVGFSLALRVLEVNEPLSRDLVLTIMIGIAALYILLGATGYIALTAVIVVLAIPVATLIANIIHQRRLTKSASIDSETN